MVFESSVVVCGRITLRITAIKVQYNKCHLSLFCSLSSQRIPAPNKVLYFFNDWSAYRILLVPLNIWIYFIDFNLKLLFLERDTIRVHISNASWQYYIISYHTLHLHFKFTESGYFGGPVVELTILLNTRT